MSTVERMHDEHYGIRSMIEQLQGAMDRPSGDRASDFVEVLQQFIRVLNEHFDFEENDGLFDDLRQQSPTLDRKFAQLVHQHEAMRASFSHALVLADEGKSVAEVTPLLREAIAALREHERVETGLIQEAMITEIGVGD